MKFSKQFLGGERGMNTGGGEGRQAPGAPLNSVIPLLLSILPMARLERSNLLFQMIPAAQACLRWSPVCYPIGFSRTSPGYLYIAQVGAAQCFPHGEHTGGGRTMCKLEELLR